MMSVDNRFLVAVGLILLLTIGLPMKFAHAEDTVQAIDFDSYIDSLGFFHVVGEVKNVSSETIEFVNMIGTFYDSDDRVVMTESSYAYMKVLRGGESSPFSIILTNEEQIKKIDTYKLQAEASSGDALPAKLELSVGDDYVDSLDFYHLVGEVTNNGLDDATFPRVAGAFYDDDGKIIDVGFTFAGQSISPGETAPFEFIITHDDAEDIESYSLNVQSDEYSMIMNSVQTEERNKITAVLDRGSYGEGEQMVVSGTVDNNFKEGDFVVITIKTAAGKEMLRKTSALDRYGNYEETITVRGTPETKNTVYTVEAAYNGNTSQAKFQYTGIEQQTVSKPAPSYSSVKFSEFVVNTFTGNAVNKNNLVTETQYSLTTEIKNLQSRELPFVAIMEIRDSEGFTLSLNFVSGKLPPNYSMNVGTVWTPSETGDYELRAFAITDFKTLNPLSSVVSTGVTVA